MVDPSPAPAHAPPAPPARLPLVDLAGLAALAVAVRLPVYLSPRHLTFDDGTFASSALAMRDGGLPFRDVFSSQGPLFLPLVWVGDLLGARTLNSPRVLAVVSGVAVVLAIYWVARMLSDRRGALLAGALAATAGSLAWVTGPLAADGPALAMAVVAFGLALRLRDHPRWPLAVALGVATGACLSTKAIEAHVLVPIGLVLVAPVLGAARARRLDLGAVARGAAAAISAAGVFLLVSLPWGLADVWDQSVRYRTDAADRDSLGDASKLLSTLWDRDLTVLGFAALALVAGVLAYRRTGRAVTDAHGDRSWAGHGEDTPSGRLLIVTWTAAAFFWLIVVVSPLWRPHVSAVIPPLVLLIATYRPPWRAALMAGAVAVPVAIWQLGGLLAPGDYRDSEAAVVAALRELPEGAWGISDEPGLLWRAGLRTTDDLVDPSVLRLQQGRYDLASVVAQAADPRVCAVVVRSSERFGALDGLGERLEGEGFEVAATHGGPRVLYVRPDCDPPT